MNVDSFIWFLYLGFLKMWYFIVYWTFITSCAGNIYYEFCSYHMEYPNPLFLFPPKMYWLSWILNKVVAKLAIMRSFRGAQFFFNTTSPLSLATDFHWYNLFCNCCSTNFGRFEGNTTRNIVTFPFFYTFA